VDLESLSRILCILDKINASFVCNLFRNCRHDAKVVLYWKVSSTEGYLFSYTYTQNDVGRGLWVYVNTHTHLL